MALPDLVRKVIAGPVIKIAGPFRATISVIPLTGIGTKGPIYGAPVTKKALVEAISQVVTSADGTERVSASKFTFFEQYPIHEGDHIILNGVNTLVIKVGGLLDEKGVPYLPEAWTGK